MNGVRTLVLAVTTALSCFAADVWAQRERPFKPGYWRTRKDYAEGFVVYHTRHYQIQSQCGMDKAKRLGKHMETMFRVYYKCFNPKKPFTKKYAIKLLKNRAQFLKYGAPPGAGAYYSWNPVEHEMVCYDTGKWMDDQDEDENWFDNDDEEDLMNPEYYRKLRAKYQMDILGAAAHEGWHQYFHWMVVSPTTRLPSWLNEGMGDYFYSARPKKVKGRKMPAELGRMNHMRLPIVKLAVKRQKYVPIKELIRYTQSQYYRNPSICYAQGWALCQFLMHHENIRYREIIPKFVFLVKSDSNVEAVTDKVFKHIDLDALDKEWREWVINVRMDGTVRKKGEAKESSGKAKDKDKQKKNAKGQGQ